MTDIHCHLLFGIDDGAKTIEESVEILREMKSVGYDNIILTPHYISDSKYSNSRRDNLKRLGLLKEALKENNIDIKLFLGNEIYIDDDISELLNEDIVSSLNDTNYLLIELPMSGEYENYEEVFKDLIKKDYQIILAHPERYLAFQKNFSKIYELEKIGVYFQSNIDSIIGRYGPDAERVVKRLLKEKKISFLATDIHHRKHDYDSWEKARMVALEYISSEEYDMLVNTNPGLLVSDEIM